MYYVVRINQAPKKSSTNVVRDFNYLLHELHVYGVGIWDKDVNNRIQTGDFIGFILDDGNVHFYKIINEHPPTERHGHWNSNTPYTLDGVAEPNKREVIVLTTSGHFVYSWARWKSEVGYKDNYIPRGTTRVKVPKNI